ncbi:hypothetical protein CVT25_013556 [Psilocybe cyanescens]|uniref:Uncharacterized protein n=1 Tax=Psilocybe cyanescens TaxID=93625 RepID=A0A409XT20_PSICY|nr:hypothetical protein CVT25_013556 [Psilocybe cyanescens]
MARGRKTQTILPDWSDLHTRSVQAQRQRDSIRTTGERSLQEECAIEQRMDFAVLPMATKSTAVTKQPVFKPSAEEQEMWDNSASHIETFSAGINHTATAAEERKRLEKEATDFDLWRGADFLPEEDPNDGELLFDELEQEDRLAELLRNTHVDVPSDADILDEEAQNQGSQPKTSEAWSPYTSKTMFLLDTLDNLPRMRISNSLMNVFLWVLREAGARDVPSLFHLRKVQASLRKSTGVPTVQYKSPKGNIYSMNDPRTLVAMDWANPSVCEHIRRYPVIPPNGIISEVYHAQKWRKDVDRHTLSPMYDTGNRHYYIDELARLKNGNFIIPLRWLEDNDGNVFADAYPVTVNDELVASVGDSEVLLIRALDLHANYLDLKDRDMLPSTWSKSGQTIDLGFPARMPNPDRALAQGDPLYTSWIDIFGDDVSGNRSKSWNKHWNTYISHRNLPRKFLQQEFHVHFVSTSPVATISEQFHGIKKIIEFGNAQEASEGAQVRFKIYANCGPGDNPAQSEVCGHIGGNGNYPCRKCLVGGTQQDKETDKGYHSLFTAGVPRSAQDVLLDVKSQIETACLGVAISVQNQQTKNGVKDGYTQFWIDDLIARARTLRKNHPERESTNIQAELLAWIHERESDVYNPFLTLDGFDAAVDTPVELLHTVLLGIVKYLWHGTHSPWTANQKSIYSVRLQSTERSGLSIHAIRANYIMQYANSLIGKQFKTIAQVNVFHVYDLVDDTRFLLTKAVGDLAALLWMPEIRNLEEYLSDIEVSVANVLDLFAMIDPSKMTAKIKLHLLVHLKADILRFGPLVGVATEVFECFNAIFRFCSILSNHQAPSRDIALQLAGQEALKHRLTGGWWPTTDGEWERPGSSVCDFIHSHPTLQALVGWTSAEPLVNAYRIPGSFRLKPLKRTANGTAENRKYISWFQTEGAKALNCNSEDPDSLWTPCQFAIARSEDKCFIGSWIFAQSPLQHKLVTGRIVGILANMTSDRAMIILDIFEILSTRHNIFGMPMLARRHEESTYVAIPSTDIHFLYNVQHDCPLSKCTASGKQPVMQERVESGLIQACIKHKPIERFVVNTHAFHNAHLLRAALPRSLSSPTPLYLDRPAKHSELAEQLRLVQDAKRKAHAAQKINGGKEAGSGPNK